MKLGENDIKLYLGSAEIEKIYLGTSQVYEGGDTPTPPAPVPYSGQYLTFVAEANNCTIQAVDAGSNTFQYSVDSGTTWNNLANNESTSSVNSGQTIMFKASELTINSGNGIGTLKPSVSASVQGNVMSLVYGDNFAGQTTIGNSQFRKLFSNCANITSAENLVLPATTLANDCYQNMFYNCRSLTVAPELSATTLAGSCYYNMFKGCTSLTTAPELPATTLANDCYQNMFQACRSLTVAPELSATTLAGSCYQRMFYGCTSLTTAPELPATTLVNSCYSAMFYSCTSLNYIKCLATDISASNCTSSWVDGVAATGTFVKAASMSSWTTGTAGIPDGWTVQNDDGGIQGDGGSDIGGFGGGPDDGGGE